MKKPPVEEGNIVAEYHYPGCTVYVSDAAYAGKSEAELEAVRKNARQIAREIAVRHEMRKMGLLID